MGKEKKHYRTCTLCEAICGIEITYQDDKIISIKGDGNDPFSRGHICPKAVALKDIHEDPDRLRKPIEKTASGWREISWNEALDKTANNIKSIQKKYGRNAFASYLGNPNVHNMGAILMAPDFLRSLKTRNKFAATSVDQLPHHIVSYHLFGHQLKLPVPDIDNTDFFLMIGANPIASNGSIMTVPDVKHRLKSIIDSGGDVVVIDPRKTETAEIATRHHFIRPSTDVLLLLAMINTLYKDNLVSPGKLGDFTPELGQVKNYVQSYTAESVAHLIGIPAKDITQLVIDFCSASKPVIYGRMGVSTQKYGLLCQYLIMLFNILTGRLDQIGGLLFTKPVVDLMGQVSPGGLGRHHTRVRKLPSFGGEFPVSALAEEILTEGNEEAPSIKGLICLAGNPVLSTPNGQQLDKALEKLDFMVSVDFYLNETNRHANIILPPVSPLEREHYDIVFHILAVRNTAKYSPALFKPKRDAKTDWEILLELKKRTTSVSFKDKAINVMVENGGPRALINLLLLSGPYGILNPFKALTVGKLLKHPHGIDLGPLEPSFPNAIVHKDKKIHLNLKFYMADLERVQKQFFDQPRLEENEMLLIGRRHLRSNNSWLHNSYRMVKGKNRCTAMIHNSDASRLNIENGQLIEVTSRVGSVKIEAEVCDTIMPGVISIPHGWGHNRKGIKQRVAEKHPGVSVNDLTDDRVIDELSGNAAVNGVAVEIVPVPNNKMA